MPLTLLPNFSGLFAAVLRLDELQAALLAPAAPGGIVSESGPTYQVQQLSLQTPEGERTLLQGLNWRVEPGERWLLVGPSGVGKSSLLRALAGLWDRGTGQLQRPPHGQVLFLAQRPYLVLGTLRQQLTYPGPEESRSQVELLQALEWVGLGRLAQSPGLDLEVDLARRLSPGEQQRLALARLLLARPRFAVLDEATASLDEQREAALYQRLARPGSTLISVGHRPGLARFHDKILRFEAEGQARILTAEDYRDGA